MIRYLKVTATKPVTLNDLRIFYRIARIYRLFELTENDEENNALEDFEDPVAEYNFKVYSALDALCAKEKIERLIGMECEISRKPSERFRKWLEDKREKHS